MNSGDDVYYEEEIFPNGNAKQLLSDITTWIKKQPYYALERLVCGSTVADPEVVKQLECVIKNFADKNLHSVSKKMQVKPYLLYKPGLQIGNLMPDETAQFFLFDRIVNIRDGYSVPFGLRGTIIGIHNANTGKDEEVMFDVLFDSPFPGGLAINGCSPNRAYRMSKPSILNISHGMRLYWEKINNGNIPNQKVPIQSNIGFPQYSAIRPPNVPPQPYPMLQTGNMHMQHPGYNPFFNYNAPPQQLHRPPFISHGPNTFVPYKGDHFPLGPPPPHMLPHPMSYSQRPPMPHQNMHNFNNHHIHPNGNIPYEIPFSHFEPLGPKIQQLKAPPPPSPPNDSDYLKRLLKINENNMNTSNNAIPRIDNRSSYYTVQLLKEFQMRSFGCPNYQHFNANNKFTAKLTMPDGNFVFGVPASTIELASENAAKEALNLLCATKNTTPQASAIHSPNITDWKRNTTDSQPNSMPSRIKPSPKVMMSTILKHLDIDPDKIGNTNVNFVPPQAMRNQNLIGNTVIDSTIPRDNNLQEPLQPVITAKEIPHHTVKPVKMRERKMRIAANFAK